MPHGPPRWYPEVVCQVHHGLIEGALTQLGGHDAGVGLQPFADPDAGSGRRSDE